MKRTATAAGRLCLPARSSVRSRARQCLLAVLLLGAASGAAPAFAKDPCKMVICMYGKYSKLMGKGDDGGEKCREAEAEYFDIIVYGKKGRINWNNTAKERLKRQNSCPSADRGKTKQINDKFGKSSG
ncbi:KikA [Pseudomonas chlororaphis]|uniref:KikA n=1 Tax=Pseudomonas chlororaphis TaxID=587753 RepID=UPI002D778963|nr:KikA [Pseudomonas chlororaphis]